VENAFILRSFPEDLESRQMRHELPSGSFVTTQIGMLADLFEILWRQDDLATIVGDKAEAFGRLCPMVVSINPNK
jgi:hypothetical protein